MSGMKSKGIIAYTIAPAKSALSVRGTLESTINRAQSITMFGRNINKFFRRLFSWSRDMEKRSEVRGQLSIVSCQLSVCQLFSCLLVVRLVDPFTAAKV